MSNGINVVNAGDILEVTIDRPKANAIDLATSRRLNDVFTSFRDDPALKIAIITGAGDRFFSPGWTGCSRQDCSRDIAASLPAI